MLSVHGTETYASLSPSNSTAYSLAELSDVKPIFISPNDLANFTNLCETDNFSSSINKKCENIILIYWLIIASFFFSLFSILTLYPFFKMNKPK